MKILYRQPEQDETGSLPRFGIRNCYFKKLSLDRDRNHITQKSHHHTGFELHLILDGYQEYEVEGISHRLGNGSFLMIGPNASHTVLRSMPHTQKYSITFSKTTDGLHSGFSGILPTRLLDNLALISAESGLSKEISSTLIENWILETVVTIFRLSGMKENDSPVIRDENMMISLARKYIDDNIECSPGVSDVSEYCHLSTKQLTRMFQKFQGMSPGEYIIHSRVKKIETLLVDRTLTLKQISSIMHFENEYYFNTFFKKYSGMPPGAYRSMLGNNG